MFFLQAEDGIRDLVRSRGLGDVYKRQVLYIQIMYYVSDCQMDIFQVSMFLCLTLFIILN
mgnify:CR=1 FL=1